MEAARSQESRGDPVQQQLYYYGLTEAPQPDVCCYIQALDIRHYLLVNSLDLSLMIGDKKSHFLFQQRVWLAERH
jgi:hypothetical protein